MIQINDIKIEKTSYKGTDYLSIRRWYEKDGKELPGKQGINLKMDEAQELISSIDKIKEIIK